MNEKVNILLVDDQPAKLLSYEVILGDLGENLIKAHSGREALEHLLKTDVAVVLMDVSMPELDGFELAEIIRQHPRYQRTAIIFVSGVHLTNLDLLKGYQRGAVDYVSVPVVPEILRAKVSVFADLYRKTHQLERLNRELEQRVTDRTAELEASTARLRESEARYRHLIQTLPVAIYTCDAQGRVTLYNEAAVALWGREPEVGQDLWGGDWRIYKPDGTPLPREERPMAVALREGRSVRGEEIIIERPDGSRSYVLPYPDPLYDASGQVVGAVNMLLDLTERKRVEEDQQLLADLSERIRLADDVDQLLEAVCTAFGEYLQVKRCLFIEIDVATERGVILYDYGRDAPPVTVEYKLSDYSPVTRVEMEAGRTIINNDSQTDPRTAAIYEVSYRPQAERAYIAVPLMRHGRWTATFWVSTEQPRHWQEREITLLKTVAERVWLAVEKLRLDAELRESEERFRRASDAAGALVYDVDPQGQRAAVVHGLERVVGFASADTLMSDWWHSRIHPEDLAGHLENLERCLKDGEIYRAEYRVQHTDGSWVNVEDTAQVVRDREGLPIRLVGAIVDVTERKRAEEGQHLLAQIRERNRLGQELHDNVAQTLGYLNLKITVTYDLLTANQLDEVRANLRELKQIILETYGDIRGEIFNLRGTPVDDVDFLETLRQYRDKYQRFYHLDIPLIFEADEALFDFPSEVSIALIRTIQEALMNVRKHAQVDRARIRLGQGAEGWLISVEDEGRGFELDRVAGEKAASYGLKIMQERMEALGGHLEIKSTPGQGTQVTLLYPRG